MKQQHWILLATTALLVSPLTVRNAGAQMMQGVCSYSTNYGTRTAWKKLCVMDPRNSGNIEVITNNGSIWFMLNDSRNNTYKYNQKIWVLETIGGYVGNGASFRSGGDVLTFAVLR